MLPDWISNAGPLTYEPGALPIALHGPAQVGDDQTGTCILFGKSSCQILMKQACDKFHLGMHNIALMKPCF